jgi:hypothetical protein
MSELTAIQPALRAVLVAQARRGETIQYRDLAAEAQVPPPHTIHKTAEALEEITRADHEAGRPLLATLAVGKANGGLPGAGFFQLLRELGRYEGPDSGPEAADAHARELSAALAYWGAPRTQQTG